MSEYVITKEQLERALYRAFTLEDSRDILTRPLSSELMKERERVLDELEQDLDVMGCPSEECCKNLMYLIIKSLRSEQP